MALIEIQIELDREDLVCPYCNTVHEDIDIWALKPHKSHLCLNCNMIFEGTIRAVSHPRLTPDFQQKFKAIALK